MDEDGKNITLIAPMNIAGAFPNENPPIDQTVGAGFKWPIRMPFTPRGLTSITPFTTGEDEAAPVGSNGVRVGKFTHPSAAPNNDLLVVWTPGPANDLNRPSHEAWPRAVHGLDEPAKLEWLPNDGSAHPDLPPGTPYGIVGTSSFYKRESFPGIVSPWSNTYDGLDAFNTAENGQSRNWE